jgi:hypothetical protein
VRKRRFLTQLSWMVSVFLLGAFVWVTSVDRPEVSTTTPIDMRIIWREKEAAS